MPTLTLTSPSCTDPPWKKGSRVDFIFRARHLEWSFWVCAQSQHVTRTIRGSFSKEQPPSSVTALSGSAKSNSFTSRVSEHLRYTTYKPYMYVSVPPDLALTEPPVQLSITYRHGSSTPEQCWYLIGYGIRAAQDIGLNRRNPGLRPTVENELRKRVFWMFILADSLVSAAVGRPPAVELSEYVNWRALYALTFTTDPISALI